MKTGRRDGIARNRILDAARRLFATSGFHQTPVAKLASESDVSVGLIYREFADKEELICEISRMDMERRVEEIDLLIDELSQRRRPVHESLSTYVEHSMNGRNSALSYDILAEARRNPIVEAHVHNVRMRMRILIQAAAALSNQCARHTLRPAVEEGLLPFLLAMSYQALPREPALPSGTAAEIAQSIVDALRRPEPDG